jgi:hypothetical protein
MCSRDIVSIAYVAVHYMHDIAIVLLLCIWCIYDSRVLQTSAELVVFFLTCVNT